ncbi:hypothetical protein VULLAG_LOCUS11476 [Vulpes lagopus]
MTQASPIGWMHLARLGLRRSRDGTDCCLPLEQWAAQDQVPSTNHLAAPAVDSLPNCSVEECEAINRDLAAYLPASAPPDFLLLNSCSVEVSQSLLLATKKRNDTKFGRYEQQTL